MENSHENGNGVMAENGHSLMRHSTYQSGFKLSLQWLDLRVFYIRITKCELDDLTAEYLTVNYVPLKRNTLLEVNGARTGIYSDGVSTVLRRDRFDKKSEEVTFVCTDSISMTGSVKFEVFDRDVLVLSGSLDLCDSNGFLSESENHGQSWNINCEMDVFAGSSLQKGNQHTATDLTSPVIEVYIAGCFSGKPIILTRALQLGHRRKQLRHQGMLESIPEYEATESEYHASSSHAMQVTDHAKPKQEYDEYNNLYSRMEYIEGEDGELSWFNAGVRVGVGIGLSICVGVGIGAGLLARTYQGTTRNFRRRLL